jgi:hypothetical protein
LIQGSKARITMYMGCETIVVHVLIEYDKKNIIVFTNGGKQVIDA